MGVYWPLLVSLHLSPVISDLLYIRDTNEQHRFPTLIEEIGLSKSTAIFTAMIIGVSILPTMLVQWKGERWHK